MSEQQERLQKILSAHAIASRREAERMILAGRVYVNGVPATIGQSARYGIDSITVDGKPLKDVDEHVYLMLNKPRGYITTVSDDRGRKTVMELLANVGVKVYPAGRLDMDSEGLLLFTNDGEFANKIMHPSFEKQKVYEVEVNGDINTAVLNLKQPIEIDGHIVNAVDAVILNKTDIGGTLNITIAEGRNRQIRKMCAACGISIRSLKRISVGSVVLGSLKNGKWRHLTEEEVQSLG